MKLTRGPWVRALGNSYPFLTVILLVAVYSAMLSYLAVMKFYTFHATYGDLGIGNHILWLLSHGGIREYYASHYNLDYGVPIDQSFVFVLVPLYAVFPTIYMLLILQSCAIGAGAIPLYFLTKKLSGSRFASVIVSACYLGYFPLVEANLFDFHFYAFAPLLYLSMCAFWAFDRRILMFCAAILTAMLNPLMLIMVAFFLVYLVSRSLVTQGRIWDLNLEKVRTAVIECSAEIFVILGLAVFLFILVGTGYIGGAGYQVGGGSGLPPAQIFSYQINEKLLTLVLLLGAVAFLPLLDFATIWLLIPYFGFVTYSTFGADYSTFGEAFPLQATGAIFFGVSRVISARWQQTRPTPEATPTSTLSRVSWRIHIRNGYSIRRPRGSPHYTTMLVLVTVVFAAIYFPLSPLNQDVTGGYFAGNEDTPAITTITPEVTFLWKVIDLIPPGAAVLSQNDIPQVSGREFYQLDQNYNPAIPYNYILADSSFTWFSSIQTILPFIESGLVNRTFGVLASGLGALLLERNYSGPPLLYVPASTDYPGDSLSLYSAAIVGSEIVGSTAAFSMWYGPGISLLPGSYSVTYNLSSNITSPATQDLITIDVTANSGAVTYASRQLFAGNFSAPNEIQSFTLAFNTTSYITAVEFRGMFPTGYATITLKDIWLDELSPAP